ncbi:hypothetical protein LCGC14_1606580 [marine sediment metagenome]|uniref:Uncharacterized protein n=1 Tax=marine sediment metagenome TaxID=412755 RepID=A0A0F9I9K2_9ZZZZ
MKLNILKVGVTIEHEGETLLIFDGDMPLDCVVVFMDKDSWAKLKEEIPSAWAEGLT